MADQLVSADPEHFAATPTAPATPPQGTWEDRGIAGAVWHPASAANERGREDNSVLGLPPELAALSAAGVARAAVAGSAGARARLAAGVQAAVGEAAPYVKYHAAKGLMRSMGLPDMIAEPLAWIVSGYKKGSSPAVTTAAADAAPAASMSATPASPATPPPQPMSAPPMAAARPALSAAESKLYFVLRAQGKTDAQASAAIQAGRQLANSSSFANLPTNIDVAKGVDARNATGTWPQ